MRAASKFTPNTFVHLSRFPLFTAFLAALGLISAQAVSSRPQQQQTQPPQRAQSPAQPPSTQQPAPPPAPPSSPQKPEPPASPSKIATEVKLVTLYATVRDKHGKIIPNLNQADFTLEEDTHPQTIKYFARESDLPLTLGLLVDTSRSQRRVLDEERSASYSFFDRTLREDKDKAFLIHFDHEVELLQDLTASREKLRSALEALETPELQQVRSGGGGASGGGGPGGSGRGGHGGHAHSGGAGTLLYDAIYLAADELMMKQKGRKALVILTDGVDRGSKESLHTAIATAQRADMAVYSIYFEGVEDSDYRGGRGYGHGGYGGGYPGGGPRGYPQQSRPDGKKILQRISDETGGEFFEVKKKLPIEQIYAQIEEELRNQYSLAYTPSPPSVEDTYHIIRVTTNQKDLVVRAREGYYSAK